MKPIITMLTALAFFATVPANAKEEKPEKKDAKTKREEKKKEEADKKKSKEKEEILYTATFTTSVGEATEADTTTLKGQLLMSTLFNTKEVKLDGKNLVATLAIKSGRLSKSDVAKAVKEKGTYKVEKVDDIKPEKEKKSKDGDKDADKEKDMKKPGDAAEPKKEEAK